MENNFTQSEIKEMKNKTMRFFWYGNLIPIIIPMSLLAFYDAVFHRFNLNGIIYVGLIGFPFFVGIAAHLYDNEYKSISVKAVDRILYFIAFITMTLIGIQINNTGGFDNSILIFYFYFIPSAIAISFEAEKGIYLTIFISFIAITYNFLYKPTDITNNDFFETFWYKALYLSTIALHLASLGLLEILNNRKINKNKN